MNNQRHTYRAWDIKNKRWIKIAGFKVQDGEMLPWELKIIEGKAVEWVYISSDVVLMQSVGLKDKAGKLIFEGDLIKAGHMIYEIAWYGMEGRLQPFTTEFINTTDYIASSGVPIRNWNWLDGGSALNYQDLKKWVEVEIIGNIYQDSHLLTKDMKEDQEELQATSEGKDNSEEK